VQGRALPGHCRQACSVGSAGDSDVDQHCCGESHKDKSSSWATGANSMRAHVTRRRDAKWLTEVRYNRDSVAQQNVPISRSASPSSHTRSMIERNRRNSPHPSPLSRLQQHGRSADLRNAIPLQLLPQHLPPRLQPVTSSQPPRRSTVGRWLCGHVKSSQVSPRSLRLI
jgi:hypothetical protein